MGPFVMSSRRVGVPIPETMDPCAPLRLDFAAKDCFSRRVHDRVWLSFFQWNHYPIRAEADGLTLPWNLVPRLIRARRRKTAKRDLPEVAKIRWGTAAEAEFGARVLAKDRGEPRRESRWPKRSFAKRRTKNESHQRRET
jgi:hypothetical protein